MMLLFLLLNRVGMAVRSALKSPCLFDATSVLHALLLHTCHVTRSLLLQRDQPCYSFIYTPAGDPLVEALIDSILQNNNPPLDRRAVHGMNNMTEVGPHIMMLSSSFQGSLTHCIQF